ncbi:MAG TPA: cytochrome c biogenesis protein CcdA [Chloroflexi bacterium]|nr:cytochrome c biogenesis protein CcdA [Chloroflexota bacterium]
MNVTIGLAFVAGLASFLSPCVLPLVPAYISYLSGRALAETTAGKQRGKALMHGLAFVLGFSLVFISLGVATSALGGLLYSVREWLARIGGVIVVIFGIHMTGIVRIPFLEYDIRPDAEIDSKGLLSSALMGIFFSAGWSPCVGPVLGAILTIALNGGSIAQGAVLLTAYSAGLAVPFLLAALSIDWVTVILQKYSRLSRIVEILMGITLIIVGAMLTLGVFSYIARLGNLFNLGL